MEDLGIRVAGHVLDVFTLNASLDDKELEQVRTDLFTDPIIQVSAVNQSLASGYDCLVEVGFLPGVTDNVGRSALEGVQDTLGRRLAPGEAVYKSTLYALQGVDRDTAARIASGLLANELIEQYVVKTAEEMTALNGKPLLALPVVTGQSAPTVHEVNLDLPDNALIALSRDRMLALELEEMRIIRDHYASPEVRERRKQAGLPAAPTDIELEILAQTWSEHCKHKIFNAVITTRMKLAPKIIDSLFKTYIKGLPTKWPSGCRLVSDRRQRGNHPLMRTMCSR